MNAITVPTLVMTILFIMSARGEEQTVMGNNCMKTFSIQRGQSPWQGMTGSAEEEKDSMKVRALGFDAALHDGFAHLKKYDKGGEPMIFRAHGKKIVGVNGRYFSDLQRADATRIGAGTVIGMGSVRVPVNSFTTPKELASLLVESQLVITFWHIGSELCLEKETANGTEYAAFFSGAHTYFTNEKNIDPLRFAVRIDLVSGAITVTGF
jgi:hypothetical protein